MKRGGNQGEWHDGTSAVETKVEEVCVSRRCTPITIRVASGEMRVTSTRCTGGEAQQENVGARENERKKKRQRLFTAWQGKGTVSESRNQRFWTNHFRAV